MRKLVDGHEFGDCFKANGKAFLDFIGLYLPDAVLVHGIAVGQGGNVLGIEMPHCWIEVKDELILDFSSGKSHCCTKDGFYYAGQIKYTEKYDFEKFQEMLDKHQHWGGWTQEMNAADEAAQIKVFGKVVNKNPIDI